MMASPPMIAFTAGDDTAALLKVTADDGVAANDRVTAGDDTAALRGGSHR